MSDHPYQIHEMRDQVPIALKINEHNNTYSLKRMQIRYLARAVPLELKVIIL